MLDVIELFGEQTTRDELGVGGVRDAFADLFFPGTSTIQTRAKYFLFVPWMYALLEAKRVSSAAIAARARKLETELMLAIEQSEDPDGLIGKRAKENVRRLASNVYWLGLETWGIRAFSGSQEQYHRSLDLFYLRQHGRRASASEFEGESYHDSELGNWNPGIPLPPAGFPQNASFSLNPSEAEYLRERILTSCPSSLLAYILRLRMPINGLANSWDLSAAVPEPLREQLEHAQNFSEVMWGAQLLYNLMLAELRPWPEKEQEYRATLAEWWRTVESRRSNIVNWNRSRFWQTVRLANRRIGPRAQDFINQWIDCVVRAGDLKTIVAGKGTRTLVDQRETQLKRGQSRLHARRPLELWNGAAGAAQMDLRWRAARRIMQDILDGLGAV